ncbi:hypothetical protein KFE25_002515 [Diacronema lutheri]|uniref:Uncharacterized protein n=1 Tax=Diacronema lutheri TaxID=2081491 RepID=A0A8J5X4F0_DIALT|nr:hypothetical protein KFE25_002515 [Diacronema lutheri]
MCGEQLRGMALHDGLRDGDMLSRLVSGVRSSVVRSIHPHAGAREQHFKNIRGFLTACEAERWGSRATSCLSQRTWTGAKTWRAPSAVCARERRLSKLSCRPVPAQLCTGKAAPPIADPCVRAITPRQLRHALACAAELCAIEGWEGAEDGAAGARALLTHMTLALHDMFVRFVQPARPAGAISLAELLGGGGARAHLIRVSRDRRAPGRAARVRRAARARPRAAGGRRDGAAACLLDSHALCAINLVAIGWATKARLRSRAPSS